MELLLGAHNLSKTFGHHPLFRDLNLSIVAGDKVGLIGANGTGKSTFVKLLLQQMEPDEGRITYRKGAKVSFVAQSPSFNPKHSVQKALVHMALDKGMPNDQASYECQMRLSQLGFHDFEQSVGELSGGWQKRLAIAGASLGEPDMILFDEPTNHLDWEGILWLESFLKKSSFAWLMISHDRYLLNAVTKKIVDFDKRFEGGMLVSEGSYDFHLEQKAKYLDARSAKEESLSNKLRRETQWLQRGPKARSTKAKYRIEHAEKLMVEMDELKSNGLEKKVDIQFSHSHRKTKKLLQFEHVSFSYDQKKIIEDFSTTVSSKMKVGVLGTNGVGKSSLFKLILSELKPQSGKITLAHDLSVVYFDQNRQSLDANKTLQNTLSEQGDHVIFQGRSIHIVSWAKRFGFAPQDLSKNIENLSGGEKARVLIANLMLEEADILLLDEPTNDLDIPTLEILESSLEQFNGAVLLISHDRFLLNRLCDKFLGFDGKGNLLEFADVEQWQNHFFGLKNPPSKSTSVSKNPVKNSGGAKKKTAKFSYQEKREFESMEAKIMAAEEELESLKLACEQNEGTHDESTQLLYNKMNSAQLLVESLYKRWSELEEKQAHFNHNNG